MIPGLISSDLRQVEGQTRLDVALRLARDYDILRLTTYREFEDVKATSWVGRCGHAYALAWREVKYFNRIYDVDVSLLEELPALIAYYRSTEASSVELIAAGRDRFRRQAIPLLRHELVSGCRLAWLSGVIPSIVGKTSSDPRIRITRPSNDERECFLDAYLSGFGASAHHFERAKRHMRLLFHRDELRFHLARHQGVIAGIGITYLSRPLRAGFLAGGTVLPDFRRRGIHRALIRSRLQEMVSEGVYTAVSWAESGGGSHRNLTQAGLQTLRDDASLRLIIHP